MARFAIGDRVRISDREEARHHRVPAYVKGHEGEVERVCAAQGQPETLALGEDGEPIQTVYRIHIPQTRLWPGYEGPKGDSLEIEIFEHWLESA
jgi:nitrile hydratase